MGKWVRFVVLSASIVASVTLTGCKKTETEKAVMEAEKKAETATAPAKADVDAAKPKDHPAH